MRTEEPPPERERGRGAGAAGRAASASREQIGQFWTKRLWRQKVGKGAAVYARPSRSMPPRNSAVAKRVAPATSGGSRSIIRIAISTAAPAIAAAM